MTKLLLCGCAGKMGAAVRNIVNERRDCKIVAGVDRAPAEPGLELAKTTSSVLGQDFDVEIVEAHHNQKIDAPSGTALMLADAVNSTRENGMKYTYDRHSQRKKREPAELGIHSIRGGTIVGEHEIIFAGHDEIMEIKHTALSRGIFAQGAVEAAKFIAGVEKPGLYDMSYLVK